MRPLWPALQLKATGQKSPVFVMGLFWVWCKRLRALPYLPRGGLLDDPPAISISLGLLVQLWPSWWRRSWRRRVRHPGAGWCRDWDPGTGGKHHHHTMALSKASINEEQHQVQYRTWLHKMRKKRNDFWFK
mmetsp:Transcript_79614/g.132961  ORF Transcript_79614/g.132961 Transcript_79614/m.132961 type:complete len:131 (+) Transcript_79614:530-922(+)